MFYKFNFKVVKQQQKHLQEFATFPTREQSLHAVRIGDIISWYHLCQAVNPSHRSQDNNGNQWQTCWRRVFKGQTCAFFKVSHKHSQMHQFTHSPKPIRYQTQGFGEGLKTMQTNQKVWNTCTPIQVRELSVAQWSKAPTQMHRFSPPTLARTPVKKKSRLRKARDTAKPRWMKMDSCGRLLGREWSRNVWMGGIKLLYLLCVRIEILKTFHAPFPTEKNNQSNTADEGQSTARR